MILPNAANQCRTCLAQEVDVRGTLQRGPGGSHDIVIYQCRQCRRFQQKENLFVPVEMESPQLMSICLKHLPALAPHASPKFHLVDAIFVWTEPHSMRIKIRLTVQTEIENVKIQQRCVVELIIKFKQCPDCNREYTNRTWQAVVQLRQRREQDDAPRTGLSILEMALARNASIRKNVISMDSTRNGFDFYFLSLPEAQQFSSYLARMASMRIKTTNKLVSTDVKSNTANIKHTVACDMVPLCRDDLIMVHKSAKGHLTGRLCLITKVSSVVYFVDASPKRTELEIGEVGPDAYYKAGADKVYKFLSSSRRLTRFVVLDIELCQDDGNKGNQGEGESQPSRGLDKYALADVEVVKESDFGVNDESFTCVTHLGYVLQVGDVCLGYDLATSVISGTNEWDMDRCFHHSFVMPDIVLVKKVKGSGVDDEDAVKETGETNPAVTKKKQGRAKRRERRREREERKSRQLEEAAERMGFSDKDDQVYKDGHELFEQELLHDPGLTEELQAAEDQLADSKPLYDSSQSGDGNQ
eukprot:CAMPEP_0194222902 /NCGR_PEP_ID=MMETSP0156-20130528/34025_1 /TAXON_ID=33649 /ORGANISM="Thalassionema nitzschioides, Strain L26-B" /LENGTH=526 /DNA_ID=CAMNT_0038953873 /DNA_START=88 /DNA_END=1668 /DNA_ORIENTATION=-